MTGAGAGPAAGSRLPTVVTGLAIAVLILVAALLAGGGAPQAVPDGIPDPGLVTGWAIPVLTLFNDVFTVAVAAGLLMPLLSTARVGSGHTLGRLSGSRNAGRLAAGWLVVIALWSWVSFSDQVAIPPGEVGLAEVVDFLRQVPQGQALAWEFVLVGVIAATARWVRSFGQVLSLLLVTVATAAPRVLTGHSSSSGNHDLALVALMLHVVAVVLWVGGVFALWFHLGATPGKRELAARRFSVLAAAALGVVAVSGVVSALVRLGTPLALFTSSYGWMVLVKLALLVLLGWIGLRLRRHLASGLATWSGFARLASLELMVMGAAIAVGAALSRTPPPASDAYISLAESLLGGPVPPPPTLGRLLWSFTPSGVGLLVVTAGLLVYGAALVILRRRGDTWPIWRTLAWLVGLIVVAYATFGGLGSYSHVLFSAHMGSHMLLAMLAPVFLVLGAPITLVLRALPGGPNPGEDGLRQLLAFVLRSWPFRVLTHPGLVVTVFLVSLYGVYLTSFFNAVMMNHIGHAWMQAHFLISGYLLFEIVIGSDPIPYRLPHLWRLLLILGIAPFHAFFALAVMNSNTVIGGQFYGLLDRPYRADLLADQKSAGELVWAVGELPSLVVVLALLGQWFVSERRAAARFDRREDLAGEDSELAAYNRKLADAAQRDHQKPR